MKVHLHLHSKYLPIKPTQHPTPAPPTNMKIETSFPYALLAPPILGKAGKEVRKTRLGGIGRRRRSLAPN